MQNENKGKPTSKMILFVVGIMVLFTTISLVLLYMQTQNHAAHVAGEIVAIAANEITIVNRSGNETILIITEQTKMRSSVEDLASGVFVHSAGTRVDDTYFQSKGIRIIKNPQPQ